MIADPRDLSQTNVIVQSTEPPLIQLVGSSDSIISPPCAMI